MKPHIFKQSFLMMINLNEMFQDQKGNKTLKFNKMKRQIKHEKTLERIKYPFAALAIVQNRKL